MKTGLEEIRFKPNPLNKWGRDLPLLDQLLQKNIWK